jgi:predicted secreted hydrolase
MAAVLQRILTILFASGVSGLLVMNIACDSRDGNRDIRNEALRAADVLSADSTGGFARAHRVKKFSFPQDHLAHPDFKHEWWYFTGNLVATTGERFGYQLTLFRVGLIPETARVRTQDFDSTPTKAQRIKTSNWRANHFYMGHLALTDVQQNQFYSYEKFARRALGLAGSNLVTTKDTGDLSSAGIKVWLEDWLIESTSEGAFPVRLSAERGKIALELTLDNEKAPVFHGFDGLSQKGQKAGNASYYYSMTRLGTTGSIAVGDKFYEVSGLSWLDREWSTSALEKDQAGWDWFALQLEDGRDVMFYKLRREDNSMDKYSAGTIVSKDGRTQSLAAEDVRIETLNHWESSDTGIRYPSSWNIRIPKAQLELNVEPLLAEQENNLTVRYWEGAVRVTGTQVSKTGQRPVEGFGYVELAGYE